MINIALYEPEIPPNTGNIIRLCANTGAQLHLIHPLGFAPDDKQVKRAGLDYHEWARVHHHENYSKFLKDMGSKRLIACSTHGRICYTDAVYGVDDVFLFGPETRGLPKLILEQLPEEQIIRIPMLASSRSLNLSNAVAIVLYEAMRQAGFEKMLLK
jgi:tRNA (cytidine/uridine-2'-O-)-methyltransferase